MATRVLLIEDNPASNELIVYLLRSFGYEVVSVTDGQAGLEAATKGEFDLIVCDIQMPVMDGYEVARRLKENPATRSVALVAVTALAMVGDRDKVLQAGFDAYVSKPIDPEDFVRQIDGAVKTSARKHELTDQAKRPNRALPGAEILVVDNLMIQLDLARSILEPHGYSVNVATSIRDAMAILRSRPIHLVVSDVCIADDNGLDFLRLVRNDPSLASTPFVFLTSTCVTNEDRQRALDAGATAYLTRPIEPEALLREIEVCLKRS